jgi:hypothetical protein
MPGGCLEADNRCTVNDSIWVQCRSSFHASGRMAVLLRSVIRNRNLARNHNLDLGMHVRLHFHHE